MEGAAEGWPDQLHTVWCFSVCDVMEGGLSHHFAPYHNLKEKTTPDASGVGAIFALGLVQYSRFILFCLLGGGVTSLLLEIS